MATRHAAVRAPTDLSNALALVDGTDYTIENRGPRSLTLAEGVAAPDDRVGHLIPAPDPRNPVAVALRSVTAPAAPTRLWGWSDGCTVVVTEA